MIVKTKVAAAKMALKAKNQNRIVKEESTVDHLVQLKMKILNSKHKKLVL